MIGIYKIENKINGHCYIGQSRDIERRWRDERSAANTPTDNEYESPRSRAFRKYGIENFTFTVLEECSIERLNERERYYIQKYNSYFNGYNQTLGGDGGGYSVLKSTIIEIQNALIETDDTLIELSQKYSLSDDSISKINRGLTWKNPSLQYPLRPILNGIITSRLHHGQGRVGRKQHRRCVNKELVSDPPITWSDEIIKDIYELGWSHAAPRYQITDSALRHRAKSHGWPDTIFEFRNKYRQEILHLPPIIKKEKKERPIIQQYDKNMQLIAEYDTPTNASRAILGDESGSSHITQCCMGKRKTAYKFIWRYKE